VFRENILFIFSIKVLCHSIIERFYTIPSYKNFIYCVSGEHSYRFIVNIAINNTR
jgi:hypothetical protein